MSSRVHVPARTPAAPLAGTLPAPPERAPWALPTLAADTVTSGATLSHVRAPPLPPRAAFDDVYTLALLIDNREQFRRSAKGDRAVDQSAFLTRIRGKERFPVELRALPTGDALWVARCERSVPGGPAVGAFHVFCRFLGNMQHRRQRALLFCGRPRRFCMGGVADLKCICDRGPLCRRGVCVGLGDRAQIR